MNRGKGGSGSPNCLRVPIRQSKGPCVPPSNWIKRGGGLSSSKVTFFPMSFKVFSLSRIFEEEPLIIYIVGVLMNFCEHLHFAFFDSNDMLDHVIWSCYEEVMSLRV